MSDVLQTLIDALSLGSLYALFGLGVSLVFGVMRLVNFAHGAFVTWSAYALLTANKGSAAVGIGLAVLAPAAIAVASERAVFRAFRHASEETMLIASFALNVLLVSALLLIVGSQPKGVYLGLFNGSFKLGSIRVAIIDVATIVSTLVLLLALVLFLTRHPLGVQMRAAAEDLTMARLLGVRATAVTMLAFVISGVLAGVAAIFLVGRTGNVDTNVGLSAVLFGFVAAVVGGLGSLAGAVVAGYALGIATTVLQSVLPAGAQPFRDALLFGGVFVFIVVKPGGFITSASRERV